MKDAETLAGDPWASSLTAKQLAAIPTSTLLRDVIKHDCDFFHSSSCYRCDMKLEEIDRRLPPRKP